VTRRVPKEWERVFVDAGEGNDVIRVAPTDQGHPLIGGQRAPIQITGSTGHDSISGGAGDEELSGGVGIDRIYGGGGNDFLLGGGHNDYLNGEAGNDLMIGGGGNDRLVDEVGRDHFIGGAGNDVLLSRDVRQNIWNNPDTLSGGTGNDAAQVDTTPSADNLVSIEEMIA
jgi:Ca2+-binding RTX toxin-like protein